MNWVGKNHRLFSQGFKIKKLIKGFEESFPRSKSESLENYLELMKQFQQQTGWVVDDLRPLSKWTFMSKTIGKTRLRLEYKIESSNAELIQQEPLVMRCDSKLNNSADHVESALGCDPSYRDGLVFDRNLIFKLIFVTESKEELVVDMTYNNYVMKVQRVEKIGKIDVPEGMISDPTEYQLEVFLMEYFRFFGIDIELLDLIAFLSNNQNNFKRELTSVNIQNILTQMLP